MNEQQQAANAMALMKAATHHLDHNGIVAYQIALNWLMEKASPKVVEDAEEPADQPKG